MNLQRQQGDITLEQVADLPISAKKAPMKGRKIVLMEGETTGHAHVAVLEKESEAALWVDGETSYLVVDTPTPIQHEEHKTQILEPGIWKVGRLNEKDWLNNMVRKV